MQELKDKLAELRARISALLERL
jgi:hypothetical protein